MVGQFFMTQRGQFRMASDNQREWHGEIGHSTVSMFDHELELIDGSTAGSGMLAPSRVSNLDCGVLTSKKPYCVLAMESGNVDELVYYPRLLRAIRRPI